MITRPAERVLLGPGPSVMAPRVTRALAAPMLSHLDPEFVRIMDDVRARLARVLLAPDAALAFAVSGTGSAGMECVVANLVAPGARVLSVVNGYFGDRLAQTCARYGAAVTRHEVEWGRACDPQEVRQALVASRAAIVTLVHAETSTGVLNPLREVAAVAREHDALIVVDAVTSLGGMPLSAIELDIDALYSCSQKCLGAPPGLAPVLFMPRALERRVTCRSFYFDLALLEDYWLRRKYHHTMSAPLVFALREALTAVAEEGLVARWLRHEQNHQALLAGAAELGLTPLAPPGERLWTLNALRVPAGVDEAAVRRRLLESFNLEIGAGLGPLAGKIFRIGLMGAGSTAEHVTLCLAALGEAMKPGARGGPN